LPPHFAVPVPPSAARVYSVESHTSIGFTPPAKYGPDRRRDQHVQVFGRRAHAQPDLGGQHERPQVERVLAARGGHPLVVDGEQLGDRRQEQLVGQLRHREAARGAAEPAAFASGRNEAIEPSCLR
jgi:hypothetical protein